MRIAPVTENRGSPRALAGLLQKFHMGNILSDSSRETLWKLMVETETGPDRIKGRLPAGTIVAHKTGTGSGGLNDVGIVQVPGGNDFAIAVFINNSVEDEQVNARIIAEIAKAAHDYFSVLK